MESELELHNRRVLYTILCNSFSNEHHFLKIVSNYPFYIDDFNQIITKMNKQTCNKLSANDLIKMPEISNLIQNLITDLHHHY